MNISEKKTVKGRGSADVSYLGKSIDQMIWEFIEEKHIPGLTLAIVQAPYIPRVVGYGVSDVEQQRLASSRTLWPIGPISQAYNAVAVMQLCERGKLTLEDAVGSHVPDLPEAWASCTLLQLIRHCTGIPDYRAQEGFDATREYTPQELIDLVKDTPRRFAPDTDVEQSATNFLLLAEAVEKASGMSYHDFITQHQIAFLHLKHTCFFEDLAALQQEYIATTDNLHTLFKKDKEYVNPTEAAAGYDRNGTLAQVVRSSALKGFADLWASAEDVSFWDICLAGSILVKKPENRSILYSPFTLKDGRTIPAMAGWQFYQHRGLMDIKGAVPGFSSFLSRFTDAAELVCVTLLGNKEGVDFTNLGRKIAGAFGDLLGTGYNDNTLNLYECAYDVPGTMRRIEVELRQRSIPIFAKFDHGGNAVEVKLKLRPTQVIVFGAPAVGTQLMQQNQSIAMELPLRIAVWQDEHGSTWLAFPRLDRLAGEYGMEDDPVVGTMLTLLEEIAAKASSVY